MAQVQHDAPALSLLTKDSPAAGNPAVPYEAQKPARARTPHRFPRYSTERIAVPRTTLLELLRTAARLRDLDGEPYSEDAAAISLLLDFEKEDGIRKQADYMRLWGWSKQQMADRWKPLLEDVKMMQENDPKATNLPESIDNPRRILNYGNSAKNCLIRIQEESTKKLHTINNRGESSPVPPSTPISDPITQSPQQPQGPPVPKPTVPPSRLQQTIESIYDAYPLHVGKAAAMVAIKTALATTDSATLLAATLAYAEARKGEPVEFTPYPAKWFSEQRYLDDPTTWAPAPKPVDNATTERERYYQQRREIQERQEAIALAQYYPIQQPPAAQ